MKNRQFVVVFVIVFIWGGFKFHRMVDRWRRFDEAQLHARSRYIQPSVVRNPEEEIIKAAKQDWPGFDDDAFRHDLPDRNDPEYSDKFYTLAIGKIMDRYYQPQSMQELKDGIGAPRTAQLLFAYWDTKHRRVR